MLSLHLLLGLPLTRFPSLGAHSGVIWAHLVLFILATCPAYCPLMHSSKYIQSILNSLAYFRHMLGSVKCTEGAYSVITCLCLILCRLRRPYGMRMAVNTSIGMKARRRSPPMCLCTPCTWMDCVNSTVTSCEYQMELLWRLVHKHNGTQCIEIRHWMVATVNLLCNQSVHVFYNITFNPAGACTCFVHTVPIVSNTAVIFVKILLLKEQIPPAICKSNETYHVISPLLKNSAEFSSNSNI